MSDIKDIKLLNYLYAEKLYYTLQSDPQQGYGLFCVLDDEQVDLNLHFVKDELLGWMEKDTPFNGEQLYDLYLRFSRIEHDMGHNDDSEVYAQAAYDLVKETDQYLEIVKALIALYNATCQDKPTEARQNYLEPARRHVETHLPDHKAWVYYEMGYAFRLEQQIDDAINWYEKARKLVEEDTSLEATILNDLGYACSLRGRYEDGVRYIDRALVLRQDIYDRELEQHAERGHVSKVLSQAGVSLGLTHNTKGEVQRFALNFDGAIKELSRAIELFDQYHSYQWLARAYAARTEAYRRRAEQTLYANRRWELKEYLDDWNKADADVGRAFLLFENYLFDGDKDTALRREGRLFHDRAIAMLQLDPPDYASAREDLYMAYQRFDAGDKQAHKTEDYQEQLQNLVEIAFLADDLIEAGEPNVDYQEFYRRLIERLKDPPPGKPPLYILPIFAALIEVGTGAYHYAKGDYEMALACFLDGLADLASEKGYGASRFLLHARHIQKRIERLPDDDLAVQWCEDFLTRWRVTSTREQNKKTLYKEYSDFINWLQAHIETRRTAAG